MSFEFISALWALPAVPLLAVLLVWRARRLKQTVPSLLLWNRVLDRQQHEQRSRSFFFDPAILAAILFLTLAILALSRPAILKTLPMPCRLLIIADQTASMGARSADGRTQLDAATDRCARLLETLPGEWRIALLTVPQKEDTTAHFALSRAEAMDAIRGLKPSESPGDVAAAVRRAVASLSPDDGASVLVLTQSTEEIIESSASHGGRSVRAISAGSAKDNVGIVGFHVDGPRGTVFVALRNFAEAEKTVSVAAFLDSEESSRKEYPLQPAERATALFHLTLDKAETVSVRLLPGDDLVADDAVWAVRERRAPCRVAYAGEPDLLLRKALEAAGAEVVQIPTDAVAREFPLAIYNSVQPRQFTSRHVVLIAPTESFQNVLVRDSVIDLKPVVADPEHALMGNVMMDDVTITSAVRLRVPDSFVRLVESDGQPLITTLGGDRGGLLLLAFKPSQSNWPLKASFPIFWLNVVRAASVGAPESEEFSFVRTGQTVRIQAGGDKPVSITGPNTDTELGASPEGAAIFTPRHVGIYEHDGLEGRVAANLLDSRESGAAGASVPSRDVGRIAGDLVTLSGVIESRVNLAPWLVLAAVGALGVFWLTRK